MNALSSLTGHHWTGHGDVVFFVMGAHRKDGRLKTFLYVRILLHDLIAYYRLSGSVQGNDEYARKGFQRTCPEFKKDFIEPFKAWAEKTLPGGFDILYRPSNFSDKVLVEDKTPAENEVIATTEKVDYAGAFALGADFDGFPVLTELDPEDISPKDAKELLSQFIVAAWSMSFTIQSKTYARLITAAFSENEAPGLPIPWKSLASSDRHHILKNALPFQEFDCLDPFSAPVADIYSILKTVLSEQKKGCRPLQFIFPTMSSPTSDPSSVNGNVRFDFSPPRPRGE